MATRVERVNIITEFQARGTEKYSNDVKKGSKETNLFSGVLKKAGTAIAATFAVGSVINFTKKIALAAANFESTAKSIEVFVGSAEKARKLIEQLQDFGVRTPFEDDEVIQAGKTLLAFGSNADNVVSRLEILGEAAAASGSSLGNLAFVFGQVNAQGKAQLQDLYQFINAGIPIFELLADSIGVSVSEIKKLTSEGKITATVLEQAFAKAAGEGGRFNGALEQQSQTLNGIISTIKGQFGQVFVRAGNSILPFLKNVSNGLKDFLDSTLEAGKGTKTLEQELAGTTAAFNAQIGALNRLEPGTKARAELIRQINKEYKDYLPNLLTEKSTLEDIKKAQEDVNRALVASILVRRFTEENNALNEELGKLADSMVAVEIQKAQLDEALATGNFSQIAEDIQALRDAPFGEARKAFEDLAKGLSGLKDAEGIELTAKDFIKLGEEDVKKQLDELRKLYTSVASRFGLVFDDLFKTEDNTPGGGGTGLGFANDSLKALQERLAKIEEQIQKTSPDSPLFLRLNDQATRLREAIDRIKNSLEALAEFSIKTPSAEEIIKKLTDAAQKENEEAIRILEERNALIERANVDRDNRALRLQRESDTNFSVATIAARKALLHELELIDENDHKRREAAFKKFDKAILDAQVEAARENLTAAFASQDGLAILNAQDALTDALIQRLLGAGEEVKNALSFEDILTSSVIPLLDAIGEVAAAIEDTSRRAIEAQQRRIEDAVKLAENGNAELLQLEEDRLKKAEEQQRKAAQLAREVAAIQFIANSAIAISKAAATEGPLALALIPAILATIAGGIAQARALSQGFAEGTEYVSGKPGRDKIPARLTKGERVVDAPTNSKLNGFPNEKLPDAVAMYFAFQKLPVAREEYFQRQDRTLEELKGKMDKMADAINNMGMYLNVDELGLHMGLRGVDRKIARRDGLFYDV